MKGFYLLSCVCIAMFVSIKSEEGEKKYTEKLSKHVGGNACQVASGLTSEYLMQFGNKTIGDLEAPGLEEAKNKVGCYMSCMLQEKGMMNKNKVNAAKLIDVIQKNIDSSEEVTLEKIQPITNIIQNCAKEVDNLTNECEVGWKFGKCVSDIITFA